MTTNPHPTVIPIGTAASSPTMPTPAAPDHLTEEAKGIWDQLAPLYRLNAKDLVEFEAFCEAVAEFREASSFIADSGLAIIDPDTGMPIGNPMLSVRNQADRKIASWAARFR